MPSESIELMNAAAEDAENNLRQLVDAGIIKPESVQEISHWWQVWFLKAGHKRLGRIIVKFQVEGTTGE